MDKKRILPLAATKVQSPFSKEQVEYLNAYQESGLMHPYTCPKPHPDEGERVLVAATAGWWCPEKGCPYKQNWAHAFMADPEFLDTLRSTTHSTEDEWHRDIWKDMTEDQRNDILREKGLM